MVAGFNRRTLKTACPVVWEGLRAQSRRPDPIKDRVRRQYMTPYPHKVEEPPIFDAMTVTAIQGLRTYFAGMRNPP